MFGDSQDNLNQDAQRQSHLRRPVSARQTPPQRQRHAQQQQDRHRSLNQEVKKDIGAKTARIEMTEQIRTARRLCCFMTVAMTTA